MDMTSRQPVTGACVWKAADYAGRDDWMLKLCPAAIDDIDRALAAVKESGIGLEDVVRDDFPLAALAGDLEDIAHELGEGRGFAVIRGLPVERYSQPDLETIFWGLGAHLGTAVSQSHRGDRMGHVTDMTHAGEAARSYRSPRPLAMHMDPTDVVALLCLRTGASGGLSRITSSMAVHNEILDHHPDYLDALYAGYRYRHAEPRTDGEPALTLHKIPIFGEAGGRAACFYVAEPITRAVQVGGVELSPLERDALTCFRQVAEHPDMYLEHEFQVGDLQFLNNRVVLHSRTAYADHDAVENKRHLLRLWLIMPDWARLPPAMKMIDATDRLGGGMAKADAATDETKISL
jgi:hypothetical protein